MYGIYSDRKGRIYEKKTYSSTSGSDNAAYFRWSRSLQTAWNVVINKPYLALGADLSPQEQMTVLSLLGLDDINVDDYDIISITNADEHEYLDKYLDASIIGTRALSSVLVVGKEAGNGIHVTTKNISYCTEGMYSQCTFDGRHRRCGYHGGRTVFDFRNGGTGRCDQGV